MVRKKTNSKRDGRKLTAGKRLELNALVETLLHKCLDVQAGASQKQEWDAYLEIYQVLQAIQKIEKDIQVPQLPPDRFEHLNRFADWLKENGARFANVDFDFYEDYGCGLKAKSSFAEGEIVLSVPEKLMMTTDSAAKTVLGALLQKDPLLSNMPNVALSIYLLVEKQAADSFWNPYISILPNEYSTVMYFTSDELEHLKGSPVFDDALKQCRNVARQYAYFYHLFQKNKDAASEALKDIFTYQEYRWAVSTVMTRQNCIPDPKCRDQRITALVPLWDMCNHANGPMCTDFNCDTGRLECFAFDLFRPGDQLLISYGTRSNANFLLHNGFVMGVGQNANDTLAIKLGVSRDDPLHEQRKVLLEKLNLPPAGTFYVRADAAAPVDGALLAFLRVFNMTEEHLKHWQEGERCFDLEHPDCSVDTVVEDLVWKFLLTRVTLLLKAYDNVTETVEQMVKSQNTSHHTCMALLLKMNEKKLLTTVMEYVQQRISKVP